MTKKDSSFILKSSNGFVLIHVLIFFLFFTTFVSSIVIQKDLSLRQQDYYRTAFFRISTEKEILSILKNHVGSFNYEEFDINGFQVSITYGQVINVKICDDSCYQMIVEYDPNTQLILSISYE
jgi:hypothetical protein